jgi:ABC-type sugar transport system ATPase subunit
MNFESAHTDGDTVVAGPFRIARPAGPLPALLQVGVRPEHVRVEQGGTRGESAEVVAVEPLGAQTHLVVRVGDLELRSQQATGFATIARGAPVRVSIDDARALLFRADGDGERL